MLKIMRNKRKRNNFYYKMTLNDLKKKLNCLTLNFLHLFQIKHFINFLNVLSLKRRSMIESGKQKNRLSDFNFF